MIECLNDWVRKHRDGEGYGMIQEMIRKLAEASACAGGRVGAAAAWLPALANSRHANTPN